MARKFVKFIGDLDALLLNLPEQAVLREFFIKFNKFELMGEENGFLEIFCKIAESHHYFYILPNDVEPYEE